MKQDTDWNMASTSYNPLELYWLIEKMTLAQTEDQYPFATVYDQELNFYSFWQEQDDVQPAMVQKNQHKG
jgi:hypothetical protein